MEFGSDFVFAPQSADDEYELVAKADLEKATVERVRVSADDDGEVRTNPCCILSSVIPLAQSRESVSDTAPPLTTYMY